jgi:nicotinate phosphoribosyltransferase
MPLPELGPRDALIVVDLQKDFCPGGALAVPEGDAVVGELNQWIDAATQAEAPVVASRDWHPEGHCSFAEQGGPWPPHCIEGTPGAAIHADLRLPETAHLVNKGVEIDRDNYSAFDDTGLADWLRERGVRRIFIGGLAQEVCVRATVLDAVKEGFQAHLILDATRSIDQRPGDGLRAVDAMQAAGAQIVPPQRMDPAVIARPLRSALFTDWYELTMGRAYDAEQMDETAVFELFYRSLPEGRNYAVAAGLESVLTYLEQFRFTDDDLEFLAAQGGFSERFIERLRGLRFEGDVHAVREGTVVFPGEPILRVEGPMLAAQLVETLLINQIHMQTVLTSKAARVVAAAEGRTVVDFGSRRAHGVDAALKVARAAYLVGAAGTSNVLAGRLYGIPVVGTMAHSYIQSHDSELAAFAAFTRTNPQTTLLVDTYDTLEGVRQVIELARRQGEEFDVRAVRLDSGDLAQLAKQTRKLLDEAGLQGMKIVASGGLDEYKVADLLAKQAPIDGFGVGTKMVVAADAPDLDFAYKLVEYAGKPRIKLSAEKVVYPGRKQVFRRVEGGQMVGDVIARADETRDGTPLLEPVMRRGRRLAAGHRSLAAARDHALAQLAMLPESLKALRRAETPYPVEISPQLQQRREATEDRISG